MKKGISSKKLWLTAALIGLVSLGVFSTTTGCAGRTHTSTLTTTTEGAGSGSTSVVTTQKEVSTDAHPRGVIGGLFYTIGQVLLFPFKVIGSLF